MKYPNLLKRPDVKKFSPVSKLKSKPPNLEELKKKAPKLPIKKQRGPERVGPVKLKR